MGGRRHLIRSPGAEPEEMRARPRRGRPRGELGALPLGHLDHSPGGRHVGDIPGPEVSIAAANEKLAAMNRPTERHGRGPFLHARLPARRRPPGLGPVSLIFALSSLLRSCGAPPTKCPTSSCGGRSSCRPRGQSIADQYLGDARAAAPSSRARNAVGIAAQGAKRNNQGFNRSGHRGRWLTRNPSRWRLGTEHAAFNLSHL